MSITKNDSRLLDKPFGKEQIEAVGGLLLKRKPRLEIPASASIARTIPRFWKSVVYVKSSLIFSLGQ